MKRTKTETLQPSGCCREDTIQITTQNHEEAYFAPSDRFENYLENYYIAIPPFTFSCSSYLYSSAPTIIDVPAYLPSIYRDSTFFQLPISTYYFSLPTPLHSL